MTGYTFKGFIHLYLNLFDNTISFGSFGASYPVGESLLQFIYSDIDHIASYAVNIESRFVSIHPYFSACDTRWRTLFFENLLHPSAEDTADVELPSLEDLIRLQEKYRQLMVALYNQSGLIDEEKFITAIGSDAQLSSQHCFSRRQLIYDPDGKRIFEDCFVSTFEECLFIELMEIIRQHTRFKTCKNCGRLFIPKRSNMDYCSRIYTRDGKTCAEVGYSQTFAKSVKNDKLLQAYTRAYKAHYARMTKPRKKAANMTREAFEAWQREARLKLDEARAGKLASDEFEAWLKL